MSGPQPRRYRLFSWEHSYFSGKVRAFLRYKACGGALDFEDVLATPELIQGVLIPATGSNVVPQLQTPDWALRAGLERDPRRLRARPSRAARDSRRRRRHDSGWRHT